jgi:hypothetical protein
MALKQPFIVIADASSTQHCGHYLSLNVNFGSLLKQLLNNLVTTFS